MSAVYNNCSVHYYVVRLSGYFVRQTNLLRVWLEILCLYGTTLESRVKKKSFPTLWPICTTTTAMFLSIYIQSTFSMYEYCLHFTILFLYDVIKRKSRATFFLQSLATTHRRYILLYIVYCYKTSLKIHE